MPRPTARVITISQAREHLVAHHGLDRPFEGDLPALLARHRCVQLDPLDRVGNSTDLFSHARVDGTRRGDTHRLLGGGASFEHFFKVRCLLPPRFLPHYRAECRRTGWHSYRKMCGTPDEAVLDDVLAELRERGPSLQVELRDRGLAGKNYEHPWARKATMNMLALDVLWARCAIVVVGREGKGKRWDLAERAMPAASALGPDEPWAVFSLRERAAAAGLLPANAGPWWARANDVRPRVRKEPELLGAAGVELVQVAGLSRRYLAPIGWGSMTPAEPDERMRALSPLDPLLWDRELVRHVWGFDYVWEVYKPASQRRWGYYVLPLLHRGRLVGRFEGHREVDGDRTRVVVDTLWREPDETFDDAAFTDCIDRLSATQ